MYRNVRVIPRQLLEQLYVEKQWSVREVAEYFQCSVDTIMRRMKQYDIERRPLKKDINMVHVQALYETGKWSLHSLAKRYDVSITTMASRMKEYGLACQRSTKNVSIDPVRICRAYKSGNTSDSIARMYGISQMESTSCVEAYGNVYNTEGTKSSKGRGDGLLIYSSSYEYR